MGAENKFDKLKSRVHEGLPLGKPAQKSLPSKEEIEALVTEQASGNVPVVDTQKQSDSMASAVEPAVEVSEPTPTPAEPPLETATKATEKRKRKPQVDYQSLFFTRIDFTHRKPLYITATTHRRLMRIVHLMDESKATISSYVENIILNHLETFKEDIDTIYQTNNLNPTE